MNLLHIPPAAPLSSGVSPSAPLSPVSHAEPGALLAGYRKGLYGYLRRKGFNAEEADDLTQETLIRAYLHLADFRGASLSAWLYRIASNVAVDFLRKQRLHSVPLESLLYTPADEGRDPVDALDRDERRAQIMELIGQLPECHQRVLKLRYFEDQSMAEIAGVIQCSPLAAKLRVFRALTALRKRCRTLGCDGDWIAA